MLPFIVGYNKEQKTIPPKAGIASQSHHSFCAELTVEFRIFNTVQTVSAG